MKLHNTLTRQVEELKPIDGKTVRFYSCGPTVYDYYHIGNLRNAVFNDTLRRSLELAGYDVKHVMNITDVGHLVSDADEGEDKLEKGAKREGKTVWEVAQHYTDAFKHDMAAMNILPPNAYHSKKYDDSYARATEFIDQQIEIIKLLLEKSFAYQTKQAIYFDVTKLADYGMLTGQRLADKEVGARTDVVTDPEKHNPHDFAVWFFATGHFADHTMQWESPWGNGFPGWHLECSAIIHATLGDPIDIHTGGVDHIGTHHPNEMAQTEAAFGHPLANFWVHNEFILVDGAKMAKSKGNSYTLKDIVAKGYDPLVYRLLVLQTHYRTELNFSWENIDAAQNSLKDLQAWADLRYQPNTDTMPEKLDLMFRDTRQAITEAMQSDMNTPAALASLGQLVNYMQQIPIPGVEGKYTDGLLAFLDQVFGLELHKRPDITDAQKQLIQEREQARSAKDWAKSDEIRDKLQSQGLGLRDTDYGVQWYRT